MYVCVRVCVVIIKVVYILAYTYMNISCFHMLEEQIKRTILGATLEWAELDSQRKIRGMLHDLINWVV